MRVAGKAFVFALAAAAPAQFHIAHDAGFLVAGDFDGDGTDDVLVIPANDSAAVYFGTRQAPWFRPGPRSALATTLPLDQPRFQGGYLYSPKPSVVPGRGELTVHKVHPDGTIVWHNAHSLEPADPNASVHSVRIAPLDRDFDRDGRPDVAVLWSETPRAGTHGFRVAYAGAWTLQPHVDVPAMAGQPDPCWIAALHVSFTPANRSCELLAVLSAPYEREYGGFGFLPIGPGPTPAAGQWFGSVPPLHYQGNLVSWAPSAYGQHTPISAFGSVTVKLHTGHSFQLLPWPAPPYVQRAGFLVCTSFAGITFGGCTHDYDGDGVSEMVFAEPLLSSVPDFLVIADPGPGRAYMQAFALSPPAPGPLVTPYHAASGDFTGDGRKDLLVLTTTRGVTGCQLVLFAADASARPGQPALRRAN